MNSGEEQRSIAEGRGRGGEGRSIGFSLNNSKGEDKSEKEIDGMARKSGPQLKFSLNNQKDNTKNHGEEMPHPSFVVEEGLSPNLHGLLMRDGLLTHATEASLEGLRSLPSVAARYGLSAVSEEGKKIGIDAERTVSPPVSITSRRSLQTPTIQNAVSLSELAGMEHGNVLNDGKYHLLIGVTGSITVKYVFSMIDKFFDLYTRERIVIQVILTAAAERLLGSKTAKFAQLGVQVWFHDDNIKYYMARKPRLLRSNISKTLNHEIISQFVPSFQLLKWADAFLIAPLSANTLAKIVNGMSDDFLRNLVRLWPSTPMPPVNKSKVIVGDNGEKIAGAAPYDPTATLPCMGVSKPIIVALSLSQTMYSHPITKVHIRQLAEMYPNMTILKPNEKCVDNDGSISMGGMACWPEIVARVVKQLGPPENNVEADESTGGDDDNDEVDEAGRDDEDDEEDDDDDDDDEDDDDEDDEDDEDDSKEEEGYGQDENNVAQKNDNNHDSLRALPKSPSEAVAGNVAAESVRLPQIDRHTDNYVKEMEPRHKAAYSSHVPIRSILENSKDISPVGSSELNANGLRGIMKLASPSSDLSKEADHLRVSTPIIKSRDLKEHEILARNNALINSKLDSLS